MLPVGTNCPNWTLCFPFKSYLLPPRASHHQRCEGNMVDSSCGAKTIATRFPAYCIFTWGCPTWGPFVSYAASDHTAITEESWTLDTFCS